VFIASTKEGNGHPFIEAWHYLESVAFLCRMKKRRPPAKSFKDRCVLVLMVDRLTDGDVLKTLPFNIGRKPLTVFELAVMNGYRAAQCLREEKRGGVIFINTDGVYIGPLRRTGEISLVGFWANQRQVISQKLGIIFENHEGCVKKLYAKFDLEKIRGKLERQTLLTAYDFSNRAKKQFLAHTGNTIFSFETNQRYQQFFDLMRSIRDYSSGFSPRCPIVISPDILVPLIMKSSGENIYTYLATRSEFISGEAREFYSGLFDIYERQGPVFKFFATCAHHRDAAYTRADKESNDYKQLAGIIESWQQRADNSGLVFALKPRHLEDEELASLEKPITGRSPEKGHLTEQNLMDTLSEDGLHMIDAIRELERWMSQGPLERPENHSVRISSEPEDGSRMIDAIRELERWMSQGPLERPENHSIRISSEPEDGSRMIDAIRESYLFREDLTPEIFEMIRKDFSLNDSKTFALSRLHRHLSSAKEPETADEALSRRELQPA
jgi:hypothetical protein